MFSRRIHGHGRLAWIVIATAVPTSSLAQEVAPQLERTVSLSAQGAPLSNVLAELCDKASVQLELDPNDFTLAKVPVDLPITIELKDVPLNVALARVIGTLPNRAIFYEMHGEKLRVTSTFAMQARTLKALPDWLKPLYNNGLGAKVDDDGNVISITIGEKADDEFLSRLQTLPTLKDLNIQGSKSITSAGLANLASLPALEKLEVYGLNRDGERLGNEALQAASRIKSLRNLRVSECGVTDDGMRAFESMSQLTEIAIEGNRITDVGLKSLAGLAKLRTLSLYSFNSVNGRNQITDEGLKHLSGLTELEDLALTWLDVSGKSIAFPKLRSLSVSGPLVNDASIANIVKCRELRYLGLTGTQVSDEGLRLVATLNKLNRLSLTSKVVTNAGIAHLKAMPNLESIELRASGVGDEALRHLSEIKTLTRVDLYGSAEGGVNLGQVFSIKGIQHLKHLPKLNSLWITNLDSPDGFLGLSELKQLNSLVLHFTNIRDVEVELLEGVMPNTQISAGSGGKMLRPPRAINRK